MIIAIMDDAKKCPEDTAFSPQLYSSLLKVGAFKADVLEPPNWFLFFMTLFAAGLLILLTVVFVACVAKSDWRQRFLPTIVYQKNHLSSVALSDTTNPKAIVSINTELSSFLYRHTGEADDDADLNDPTVANDPAKAQDLKKKKKKKKKDLSVNQVEDLKSNLQKHLVEINNLFGKRRGQNELFTEDNEAANSSDSDDDDALAKQIAALKKLLTTNEAILKGVENDDNFKDDDDIDALDGDGLGSKDGPEMAMQKLREERIRAE